MQSLSPMNWNSQKGVERDSNAFLPAFLRFSMKLPKGSRKRKNDTVLILFVYHHL